MSRHQQQKWDRVRAEGEASGPGAQRPNPPEVWDTSFLARWPDGTIDEFDLYGYPLAAGEPLPGTRFVLVRWERALEPLPDGQYRVVGVLREADAP